MELSQSALVKTSISFFICVFEVEIFSWSFLWVSQNGKQSSPVFFGGIFYELASYIDNEANIWSCMWELNEFINQPLGSSLVVISPPPLFLEIVSIRVSVRLQPSVSLSELRTYLHCDTTILDLDFVNSIPRKDLVLQGLWPRIHTRNFLSSLISFSWFPVMIMFSAYTVMIDIFILG